MSPTPHARARNRQEHRTTLFSATQIVRPAAPASRPSGRYPVELRPSLDPNASARRAHTPAQKPKQTARTPLTGPAPSGMTCENQVHTRIPVPSLNREIPLSGIVVLRW